MPSDREKTRKPEADILRDCMMALSQAGCLVFRNNTGILPDATGRPVRFGLFKGSSDLIGIAPDGVFIAVECKAASGKATDAQERFIRVVKAQGGRAGIARCAADAVAIARGEA